MTIGFGKFQLKMSALTGLAWIGDAMELMILSILGAQLHCEWRLSGYQVALMTLVVVIGTMIGSPLCGHVSDKYGRKAVSLISGLLSAFSLQYGWLLVLQGLVGIGLGGTPQSSVGLLGTFCVTQWLPESIHFNMLVGKTEKAMATLTRIAKENGKAMPQGKLTANKQEMCPIQYKIVEINKYAFYFCHLISQSGRGQIFLLHLKQKCNLECTNLTSADYKDLLWTSFAEMPGLLVGLLVIDCIGRKKSMALSFLFSLCILYWEVTTTICIFIARAFIFAGFQVAYVYTTEVFPTENRASAMGISSAISRMGVLITTLVAQVLLRTSMFGALSFYCGLSLLGGVASLILPFETLGRVMQESSLGSGGLRADHHHNQPVK
uniref:SV2 related protein b n=1 Tax=Sander lucioperca TaxID=283035 RepID=A0A8C9YNA6_SANLU